MMYADAFGIKAEKRGVLPVASEHRNVMYAVDRKDPGRMLMRISGGTVIVTREILHEAVEVMDVMGV